MVYLKSCKQQLQAFTILSCCHTGLPPNVHVIRWYLLAGLPHSHSMFQSTNGGGMPNLRDAAKQNLLGLSASASSVGMASSHEPAPLPLYGSDS